MEKYHIQKIPYPFENKQQYEASQRMPIGKEWNTLSIFRKQVQPRVTIKPGVVIAPMKMSNKDI